MFDSALVSVSGLPCGLATLTNTARTSSFTGCHGMIPTPPNAAVHGHAIRPTYSPLPPRSIPPPPSAGRRSPGHDETLTTLILFPFRITDQHDCGRKTIAKVAFLGLGVVGYPMAVIPAKAGHDVTVYNRTAEKAARESTSMAARPPPTPKL